MVFPLNLLSDQKLFDLQDSGGKRVQEWARKEIAKRVQKNYAPPKKNQGHLVHAAGEYIEPTPREYREEPLTDDTEGTFLHDLSEAEINKMVSEWEEPERLEPEGKPKSR